MTKKKSSKNKTKNKQTQNHKHNLIWYNAPATEEKNQELKKNQGALINQENENPWEWLRHEMEGDNRRSGFH